MRILPSTSPGDTVRVRDGLWRVQAIEHGRNCSGWQLEGLGRHNAGAVLTVLTPFDEIVRVDGLRLRLLPWLAWRAALADVVARAQPADALRAPSTARVRALPYQLEPARAVIERGQPRILIADDVGLGKTLQAGLILLELALRRRLRRALIIVPAGLLDQWEAELAAGLDVEVARISWDVLRARQQRAPHVHPWEHDTISLVSLDFLRQPEVLRGLLDIDWEVVVVDEAHLAAGRSHRTDAVSLVAARSVHVILLSATPHPGDLARFESLLSIGSHRASDDEMLVFRRTRATDTVGGRRRTTQLRVRLHEAEQQVFALLEAYIRTVWRERRGDSGRAARLAMLVLRKRAYSGPWPLLQSVQHRLTALGEQADGEGAQPDLPFETMARDDEPPVAWSGIPGLAAAGRERAWLGAIAHAARAALHHDGKLRVLRRLVARTREPLIVFTEYRDALEHVGRALARAHTVCMVHGGLTPEGRAAALEAFARGRARVLMATDAASEGLNLHRRCRWVVHLELPWSPTRLEQRTGRVDRLGQTRRVHVTRLVLRETGEAALLSRLEQRHARIAHALEPSTQHVRVEQGALAVQASASACGKGRESHAAPLEGGDAAFAVISRRGAWRRREREGPHPGAAMLGLGFYYVLSVPILVGGAVVEEAAIAVHVAVETTAWARPRGLRARAAAIARGARVPLDHAALTHAAARARQVSVWSRRVADACRVRRASVQQIVDENRPPRQASLFEGTRWDPAGREASPVGCLTPLARAGASPDDGANEGAALGTPRLVAVLAVRP